MNDERASALEAGAAAAAKVCGHPIARDSLFWRTLVAAMDAAMAYQQEHGSPPSREGKEP